MFIGRRSQSATEYIIILAVVLIIAGLVISSFSGVTLIGSSSDELSSRKFWQSADIAITSIGFIGNPSLSSDLNMSILNNFPTVISIEQINISQSSKDDANIDLGIASFTLNPGQEVSKTADLNTNNPCYSKSPGDKYDIRIVFKYKDEETQKTYYFDGANVRLKGICATS